MNKIVAALGYDEKLRAEAEYTDQKLDILQQGNEAYARFIEAGGVNNAEAHKLYEQEYANYLKRLEQADLDHTERMLQIDEGYQREKRDNDLKSLLLDEQQSVHAKRIAEIEAERDNTLADIATEKRTADPARHAELDRQAMLARTDAAQKLDRKSTRLNSSHVAI
jgi:hypothetical protein